MQVMKFNPASWVIPYTHVGFNDPRQLLTTYSMHLLLILITSPIREADVAHFKSRIAKLPNEEPINTYQFYISKLHRANDFQFVLDGISRVLSQPVHGSFNFFPGSPKQLRLQPEMLMILLQLLQHNRRMKNFLIDTSRVLDFLILLLYYALEYRNDPAQVGLVRLCAFILQPLSADAKFCQLLNTKFENHSSLPGSMRVPAFHGTYADYLIISIYTLIATTRGTLTTIYPALFLSLSNMGPHLKYTSVAASTKLMQLLSAVASPSFVLANESNHVLLHYCLEALSSVLERHLKGEQRASEPG